MYSNSTTTLCTDPDKDLLLLLGLLVDVFLSARFFHPTCTHVPSPPAKQLDGMGQCRAFVPAILLTETKTQT